MRIVFVVLLGAFLVGGTFSAPPARAMSGSDLPQEPGFSITNLCSGNELYWDGRGSAPLTSIYRLIVTPHDSDENWSDGKTSFGEFMNVLLRKAGVDPQTARVLQFWENPGHFCLVYQKK